MIPTEIAAAARHHWWLFLLRGLLAIAFGLFVLMRPGLTLVALLAFVAAYALVDGIVTILSALRGRQAFDRWWVLLVQGLISAAFGVLAFIWPGLSLIYIVIAVAAWMFMAAVVQFLLARVQRAMGTSSLWATLGGIISLVLSILAIVYPGRTLLTVVTLIAWLGLFAGAVQLVVAFRVRSIAMRLAAA